ncbi:MAG: WhiB family transcriptional regulator [Acidimicrobiales bacterium]
MAHRWPVNRLGWHLATPRPFQGRFGPIRQALTPTCGRFPSDSQDVLSPVVRFEGSERPGWHTQAACRGQTDAFFPPLESEKVGRNPASVYAEARQLRDACQVQVPCSEAGATERFGMWAGTTPAQREARRRRWHAA